MTSLATLCFLPGTNTSVTGKYARAPPSLRWFAERGRSRDSESQLGGELKDARTGGRGRESERIRAHLVLNGQRRRHAAARSNCGVRVANHAHVRAVGDVEALGDQLGLDAAPQPDV